jgi:hypothetical protein
MNVYLDFCLCDKEDHILQYWAKPFSLIPSRFCLFFDDQGSIYWSFVFDITDDAVF